MAWLEEVGILTQQQLVLQRQFSRPARRLCVHSDIALTFSWTEYYILWCDPRTDIIHPNLMYPLTLHNALL